MKRHLIVLLACFLIPGCSILKVNNKFPDVPAELLVTCPPLKTVDPANRSSKTLLNTVVQNYGEYKICASKEEEWINWYKFQVQNYKGITLWR